MYGENDSSYCHMYVQIDILSAHIQDGNMHVYIEYIDCKYLCKQDVHKNLPC